MREKKYDKKIVVRVKDDTFRAAAAEAIRKIHGQDVSDFIREQLQRAIDLNKQN